MNPQNSQSYKNKSGDRVDKVDFSKCQRCHKRKSPIYDKRYKKSISCICKKCIKEFYG